MYKLLIYLVVMLVLGFGIYYYKNVAEEQERIKNMYASNNVLLLKNLRKVYNDKVATDKRNAELEAKAKEDINFNWYADISNSPVILELKK